MTVILETKLANGKATQADIVGYLLTHTYADVLRLAQSVLRDPAAAEDVAQKTMLRATQKIGQYVPETNLHGWVFKIGLNIARSELRKRKTRERLTLGLVTAWGRDAVDSAENQLIQSQQNQRLWQAVNQLNDKHRLPILLHHSFDLSTQEVADLLNIPRGTVLSRLYHAHRKLRQLLEMTA